VVQSPAQDEETIRVNAREAVGAFLVGIFRATERMNKDAILDELDGLRVDSILDCGCGEGSFTSEIRDRVQASLAAGVEMDPTRVRQAQSRGIEAVEADLNDGLPYPDASFDVVHSNQVIEHVVDTDSFLRETRRVLRPGGLAVVSTNNMSSWHNVLSLALGLQAPPMHASGEVVLGNPFDPMRGNPHPTRGDSHLRLFSYRGLREVCEYHEFTVLRYRSVGYYPLPPRLAQVANAVDKWHGAFLVATLTRT
jgi:methionine biosynthesis protein MetW